MAEEDVTTQCILRCVLLPVGALVVLYYLKKKYWASLQDIIFAAIWSRLMGGYHSAVYDKKKEFFASLNDVKSADSNLRNKGLVRILEIGPGPGSNFEFYPANCQLSVVEPNIHFEGLFYEQIKKHQDINFQKYYVASAEDMAEIEDNSFDVVVSFLVLCSVGDVKKTVQEVRRVLAPGGKFYFWEHVHDRPGTRLHLLQNLLTWTLWPIFLGNCHLNRNTDQIIKEVEFSHVDQKRINLEAMKLITVHATGIATK